MAERRNPRRRRTEKTSIMTVYLSGRVDTDVWHGLGEYYRSHPELEEEFHSLDQWLLDMALYKVDEIRQKEARS
jgi:hypothetical protein